MKISKTIKSQEEATLVLPEAEQISVQVDAGGRANLVLLHETELSVTVESGAQVKINECRQGGGQTPSNIKVDLLGEAASVEISSALIAACANRIKSQVEVNHFASRTTSRIMVRGVLACDARIEHRGLVHIQKGTQGCVGNQRAEALLLSPGAKADLMPDLKIDANDVHCSHAATVSSLDEHKLYYLMSRGLNRCVARETATRGFLAPALQGLDQETQDNFLSKLKNEANVVVQS